MGSCSPTTPFWEKVKGNLSKWAELRTMCLVVHFPWMEKWPDVQFIRINKLWLMVWLDGQRLRRNMTRKFVTEVFEVCE